MIMSEEEEKGIEKEIDKEIDREKELNFLEELEGD